MEDLANNKKEFSLDHLVLKNLIRKAVYAREFSYAPYSGYKVGAALLTSDERIFTGCNIENSAYSPTNCAERTAFFKAVSEGVRDFIAIAIVGYSENSEKKSLAYPCGVCRQVMMEFCDPKHFEIIVAADEDVYKVHTLAELLPGGFGPENLY